MVGAALCGATRSAPRSAAEVYRALERESRDGPFPERVEIGGQGEPLVLAETFTLLRMLRANVPRAKLSVWTNGLLLQDRIDELLRSGATGVTMSVPTAEQRTAVSIYQWVIYRGRTHTGREAAERVLRQQWSGLARAVEAGLLVTVYVPRMQGLNDREAPVVQQRAMELGAERVITAPLDD